MGYEIDFLATQSMTKSGDAICFRYGTLTGFFQQQKAIVIDGGHSGDGEAVVNHLRTYYRNPFVDAIPVIDILVSTHPDGDHIGGLQYILENTRVKELWIHQPWLHAAAIQQYFNDKRYTAQGTKSRLQKDLDAAYKLVQTARFLGVTVKEPFQGMTGLGGVVTVLGPSKALYQEQLALYRLGGSNLPALPNPTASYESYAYETLDAGGGTSPMNETSVVLWVQTPDGNKFLLTGDSGIHGLTDSLLYALVNGISTSTADVIQIPHHGSRRNVNPTIMNLMLDRPPEVEHQPVRYAIASCAMSGSPKHPSDRVLNAFIRRGCLTLKTAGTNQYIYRDAPYRPNYFPVYGHPLQTFVSG